MKNKKNPFGTQPRDENFDTPPQKKMSKIQMKKKILPCVCLIFVILGGYTLVDRYVVFEANEFVEVAINSPINEEIKIHGEIQVGILSTILNPVGSFYHSHRKWFSTRMHSSECCFIQKLAEQDKKRMIWISIPCETSILKITFYMGKRSFVVPPMI